MRLGRMRAWLRQRLGWIPRPVRRAIIGVIGGTLLLLALVGIILPVMPGFIFLPFGLTILAVEFAWAARWLKRIKRGAANVKQRMRNGWNGAPSAEAPLPTATSPMAEAADPPPSQRNAA